MTSPAGASATTPAGLVPPGTTPMLRNPYHYALWLINREGRLLEQVPLEIDWEPALAWMELMSQRQSRTSPPGVNGNVTTTIEPIRTTAAELPCCAGFRITLATPGCGEVTHDFPVTYFQETARRHADRLVDRGVLKTGDTYFYRLAAYATTQEPEPPPRHPPFAVEDVPVPIPVKAAALQPLLDHSVPNADLLPGDLPVFIPQRVIGETWALTRRAGAAETGGILIGHVCHDRELPELAVTVTAQIPARHAEAKRCQLTFTPKTWAAVQAAIALRRSDEIILGWWHSHPAKYWKCQECPPERRRQCAMSRDFFSTDDQALHQTIFPKAYTIALVITHADAGLISSLYGWRSGLIEPRGFYLLNPPVTRPAAKAAATTQTPPS